MRSLLITTPCVCMPVFMIPCDTDLSLREDPAPQGRPERQNLFIDAIACCSCLSLRSRAAEHMLTHHFLPASPL